MCHDVPPIVATVREEGELPVTTPTPDLDRSVPALLLKVGHYPLHFGGVGVVRSLGRCGVDVYAVTEGRFTPAAVSRHLRGRFALPTTGAEEPADLLDPLLRVGRAIGRPTMLVPTDDEAAVVVSELADALAPAFLFPRSDPLSLVRSLASKEGLHAACQKYGVPTAAVVTPTSQEDVEHYAAHGEFPVVIKSREAFERRARPTVRSSTVVTGPDELRALSEGWPDPPGVVLQEYLPREDSEDWLLHAYTGADGAIASLHTGVKVRSWPAHAGVTSCAYSVWNPDLAAVATDMYRQLGFAGASHLDWRLDRRDSRYKLLDFNPRVGAAFRLFENEVGVDVVRAQHLALTGRPIPDAPVPEARRLLIEDADLAARYAYRKDPTTAPHAPERTSQTAFGWFALDDPLPVLPVVLGRGTGAAARLSRAGRSAARRLTGRRERGS